VDWESLKLSLLLAVWTCLVLVPLATPIARLLAWRDFPGKGWLQAMLALPLVLPPTVLGYYLLVSFGGASPIGQLYARLTGHTLVFSFEALVMASLLFNLPFAVQPLQRGFEAIPREVREAAWCSGLSGPRTFWRIELPLAWPGFVSAATLTFAHTLGEFGVVLMVGGNIPGETRTASIAIYDRVQAFDNEAAALMSAALLAVSLVALGLVFLLARRPPSRHD